MTRPSTAERIDEHDFLRVPWGSVDGHARQAGYRASFRDLAQAFGEPDHDLETIEEGDKVVFQWVFKNLQTGHTVCIQDYNATRLTSPGNKRLPTVEKFMTLPWYEWSIGAKNQEEALHFLVALAQAVPGEVVR